MKFKKLSLDEALFEDDSASVHILTHPESSVWTTYDDEFVSTELPKEDMQGPQSGSDTGITDLLITAINDEWEAIRAYNSIVETLKYESVNNPEYRSFINILNEINSEENKHVGQLQEILQRLSPNAQYIDKGRQEGRSQFNFTNGQLQIQSWGTEQQSAPSQQFLGDEACTVVDVDDDM